MPEHPLVERAVRAERELESERARTAGLKLKLEALLFGKDGPQPGMAERAENAERLLIELSEWLKTNPSVGELLPTGFSTRLAAQLQLLHLHGELAGLDVAGPAHLVGSGSPIETRWRKIGPDHGLRPRGTIGQFADARASAEPNESTEGSDPSSRVSSPPRFLREVP